MVPGLLLLAALGSAAVPFIAPRLSNRVLTVAFAIGVAIAAIASALAVSSYPWSDLVVLLMALSAGIVLGRLLPAAPNRFFGWLVFLAALDAAQFALISGGPGPSSGSGTAPPFLEFLNFSIPPPVGRFNVGIFDIVVVTLSSEWWRLRGGSIWVAESSGLVGFSLAYAFVLATSLGSIPLIPFLAAGWAIGYGLWRLRRKVVGAPGEP